MSSVRKRVNLHWGDVEADARQVADTIQSKGLRFDAILGISRGGLVPAMLLSDLLNQRSISTIQLRLYDSGRRLESIEILDWPANSLKGKRVLVVDDVSDTGETLLELKRWLSEHEVSDAHFATLHTKPGAKFIPDFHARELDGWICYPWNKREDMRMLELR